MRPATRSSTFDDVNRQGLGARRGGRSQHVQVQRNAVTPARDAVVVWICLRQLADGTGAGVAVRGQLRTSSQMRAPGRPT
jgi:hypothetical protein